ncbi:MAG: M15 family metallopeptidase [Rhodoferax sp.]|nr:M15 family metallopeptidase [Rhodoferax sp.]
MISSRDLNDLHPAVKRRALAMISACDADGITLLITSTYRDNASQDKLYAQGRGGAVGPVVTNAKGGQSWHNWRLAFDIVPIVHGKPCWATTGDAGDSWRKIGDIGNHAGWNGPGDWKRFPSSRIFNTPGGLTLADLQSGKTLRGDA